MSPSNAEAAPRPPCWRSEAFAEDLAIVAVAASAAGDARAVRDVHDHEQAVVPAARAPERRFALRLTSAIARLLPRRYKRRHELPSVPETARDARRPAPAAAVTATVGAGGAGGAGERLRFAAGAQLVLAGGAGGAGAKR
jgi:hypothetical protein